MDKYREQLEGTTRFVRIRRIKRLALAAMFLLILLLSAYALTLQGAGLQPLYFPLDLVLPLVLVLLFVTTIANFAFRLLEIRYSKRDSQRFLIAKHSIQRAAIGVVVCGLLGSVLILPVVGDVARGQLGEARAGTVEPGTSVVIILTSRDALALTQFTNGTVLVRQQSLDIQVNWSEGGTPGPALSGTATSQSAFSFTMDGSARLDYRIELYNPGSVGVDYQVRLGRVLSPALTSFIPVVLLSIAVANAGWALYLNPIRKKHSASSIFGPDHVEEVGAGERTYSEYARQPSIVSQTSPASYLHPQAPAHATPLGSFSLPPPSHAPRQAGGGSPSHVEGGGSDGGSHQGPRRDSQLRRTRSEPGPGADAKDVTALLEHATASLRANRRGEAVAAIERVLALDPRNATALAGLAEIYEADGRWEEAGATWARYEKIQTEEPEARLRHADALLKAGNRQGALRVLEEARAGFPEDGRIRVRFEELHVDVPGLLSKALVSSASGRLPEAIALLDRILVQEPDNINALVSKGIALRRSGRGAEALSLFDAALQRQPSNAAALHAKGALLEEQGAFEAALAAYEDLHEANPRNPEAWVLQAAVLAKLGRPEEALAAYREAILLEPGNVENQDKLRALESSMGSEEKFMEELFRVPGMEPARVRSLIDAGYRTADSIRRATEDELANVDGMTRTFARDLRLHFHAGTSRR